MDSTVYPFWSKNLETRYRIIQTSEIKGLAELALFLISFYSGYSAKKFLKLVHSSFSSDYRGTDHLQCQPSSQAFTCLLVIRTLNKVFIIKNHCILLSSVPILSTVSFSFIPENIILIESQKLGYANKFICTNINIESELLHSQSHVHKICHPNVYDIAVKHSR